MAPISLSEALYHDPRLPRSLQLDLDYTSPDFTMDGNISPSADMFSLGILLLGTLYFQNSFTPIFRPLRVVRHFACVVCSLDMSHHQFQS